jgi:hypothetical protein
MFHYVVTFYRDREFRDQMILSRQMTASIKLTERKFRSTLVLANHYPNRRRISLAGVSVLVHAQALRT